MKDIFDEVSLACSKLTTNRYSTSFSLGIKFLDKSLHGPIYAIYGYVRFADEIVDSFHGFDKKRMLDKFRADTYEAIADGISINPILNSFQNVINKFQIDHVLIDTFLDSMEMDLHHQEYTKEKYDKYILGSAEVVGLMCLKVFCKGSQEQYDSLKPAAMKLGSAFQKVNFMRDLQADFQGLGRSYFPFVDLANFGESAKQEIIKDIRADFEAAWEGIQRLPSEAKMGVYLAYTYYKSLFEKISEASPETIMAGRIRIPNGQKYAVLLSSYFKYKMKMV